MTPYHLFLDLPILPRLNPADNRHWRTRQREKTRIQDEVRIAAMGKAPPEPLQVARIRCTRHSSAEPDGDNLAYSFKMILDQLVCCGVLADDAPRHIAGGMAEYRWEKVSPKRGRVTIEVWEAANSAGGDDEG